MIGLFHPGLLINSGFVLLSRVGAILHRVQHRIEILAAVQVQHRHAQACKRIDTFRP
jgi:hypothetical protein